MPGTIERAYQLAREGSCRTVDDIVKQLTTERHDNPQAHLAGKSLRLELRRLIKARRDAANNPSTAVELEATSAA